MQSGVTAVMITAEWGSSHIMKQLVVEHNANLNLQDKVKAWSYYASMRVYIMHCMHITFLELLPLMQHTDNILC